MRKENPNPNPRNPRKELKAFVKTQKGFERWQIIFPKLQLRN
jgi:hypothetical protein